MKIEAKKYIFENDEELTDFCMCKEPVTHYSDKLGRYYYDYDMTPEYNKAVADGAVFIVLDPDSIAVKNGHISRGLITKQINCCYECNEN